ncbi:MAG: hypothetical protein JST73_01680 [Actinobacteria bacterium]|nr:hypothetical protein [Actinomycetota bacterium]
MSPKTRRLNAYVLLGDPAWMSVSLASYLPLVRRIVATHDVGKRSWSGADMSEGIDACRRIIEFEAHAAGVELDWCIDDFVAIDGQLEAAETMQRQRALDKASEDAGWVLQIDADEILRDRRVFADCISAADDARTDALMYSIRHIHTHLGGRWFAEKSTRRLRYLDAIPGPVAVRSGTELRFIRQTDANAFWCLVRGPSDRPLTPREAIIHMSGVRSREMLDRKIALSAHAGSDAINEATTMLAKLRTNPWRTMAMSVARPDIRNGEAIRPVRLPAQFDGSLVRQQTHRTAAGASQ